MMIPWMRRYANPVFLPAFCLWWLPLHMLHAQPDSALLIQQEVRYFFPGAEEAELVWTLFHWEEAEPWGAYYYEKLDSFTTTTPMVRAEGGFVAVLEVPEGKIIHLRFHARVPGGSITADVQDENGGRPYEFTTLGVPIHIYHDTAAVREGPPLASAAGRRDDCRHVSDISSVRTEADGGPFFRGGPWWMTYAFRMLLVLLAGAAWATAAWFLPRKKIMAAGPAMILGILLVGGALRFYRVDQPFNDSLHWRQSSTAMIAENYYRVCPNIFYPEVNWSGPGPNYQGREFQTVTYLAALGYHLFGQHDWIGRSVCILFGLLGIFSLYRLVRLVWDEERALASAAILAIMPGSVIIDRSFLPDPAMVALVTTSFWMLAAYLKTGRTRHLVLATVTGALGIATKLPGAIVGLPMLYTAWYFLRQKEGPSLRDPRMLRLAGFALAGMAPVVAYYLWARHLSLTYPPYHFAGSSNWIWNYSFSEWLEQGYFLRNVRERVTLWLWGRPATILGLTGIFILPPKARWVFHFWLLGCAFFYLIGAQELVTNPWNFHTFSPVVAALSGHAIVSLDRLAAHPGRYWQQWVIPAGCLAFMLFRGLEVQNWMYSGKTKQTYALGLELSKIMDAEDLVIFIPEELGAPTGIYYSRHRGWVFPPPISTITWSQMPDPGARILYYLKGLEAMGANWLAIVEDQAFAFWEAHPGVGYYIDQQYTCFLRTPDYRIYYIGG